MVGKEVRETKVEITLNVKNRKGSYLMKGALWGFVEKDPERLVLLDT